MRKTFLMEIALSGMLLSSPVLAAPVTLICSSGKPLDMGPTTFTLDETEHTASVNWPAMDNGDISPRTMGPYPATFGPDTVTFTYSDEGLRHTFVINRVSANIDESAVSLNNGPPFSVNYSCHVGQKQF